MDVEEYIDNDHEFRKLRFDKENKCFVYESSNEITELTEESQHNYYEMVDKWSKIVFRRKPHILSAFINILTASSSFFFLITQ